MPSLQLARALGSISPPRAAHVGRDPAAKNSTTLPWVVVAAVAALLALGSCIGLIFISLSRRRLLKQQLEEARLRDASLGQRGPSRRRRLTAAERAKEQQREAMIRKSLASRQSSRSGSTSSSNMERMPSVAHSLGAEKELEMGLSRARSDASLGGTGPTWPFPEPPRPALSRCSSLSRPLLHEERPDEPPPPLLEQHPCLRGEGGP